MHIINFGPLLVCVFYYTVNPQLACALILSSPYCIEQLFSDWFCIIFVFQFGKTTLILLLIYLIPDSHQ